MKQSALALIILLTSLTTVKADYFIQIWSATSNTDKVYIDEGDTPGGVEIFKDDQTVACALGFTVKDWNGDVLAPFSYGFTSKYSLKELRIVPRGALKNSIKLETKETNME